MPTIADTILIAAPARDVYELAKAQEHFPQFMPDVESVEVLARRANGVTTRWKTLVEDAPIEWIEDDVFDDATLTIAYHLTEGDLDTFEGTWRFEDRAGETLVTLDVTYDFGVPTLAELIGPTLRKKVEENTAMMLAGLKAEAERMRAGRPSLT